MLLLRALRVRVWILCEIVGESDSSSCSTFINVKRLNLVF